MQSAAAAADTAANTKNAPSVLPVLSLNQPISDGPKNSPTLNAVFTRAIPAAAAVPRSNACVRHKKGGT